MSKVYFYRVASEIMFGTDDIQDIVKRHGLRYRKNKSQEDVAKALSKAYRNGKKKTEYELGMFELYLTNVFKLTSSNK